MIISEYLQVVLCDVQVDKCRKIADEFGKELQKISALSIKCDVTDEIEFESNSIERFIAIGRDHNNARFSFEMFFIHLFLYI